MLEEITKNVYKIKYPLGSNIYLLKKEKIFIDLNIKENSKKIFDNLKLKPKIIIFTHLHYDHIGNPIFFKESKFYASKQEIENYKANPAATTLRNSEVLKNIRLIPLKDRINNLEVIETPGHTAGSICLYYKKEKILFSGDTLFHNTIGRTDLPTSLPSKMQDSLRKLKTYNFKILCPGH